MFSCMLDVVLLLIKPNRSDLWLSKWKDCPVNILWPHPHMFFCLATGVSSSFWDLKIPYLDMWLRPEVGNDWSPSAVTVIQKLEPLYNRKTLVLFSVLRAGFIVIFCLLATFFGSHRIQVLSTSSLGYWEQAVSQIQIVFREGTDNIWAEECWGWDWQAGEWEHRADLWMYAVEGWRDGGR